MSKGEDEYTTVRLPKELMEIIDGIIKYDRWLEEKEERERGDRKRR